MKSDDVVEVNLVGLSPKETYRPAREMAAKIITEDVEIRIYNGASREILKNLNNYLWYRDQNVSKYKYNMKIYLVCGKTDLRKGIDGSAALVTEAFSFDDYDNAIFLFCGTRSDRFKALYWDKTGFVLY